MDWKLVSFFHRKDALGLRIGDLLLLSDVICADLLAMVVGGYVICSGRGGLVRFASGGEFCSGQFERACHIGVPLEATWQCRL